MEKSQPRPAAVWYKSAVSLLRFDELLSEKEPLMDANGTLIAADEPEPGFHERSISAD